MNTLAFYSIILFVYIALWGCQQMACHLTHSLIILTDSYINLYRILDISVGILHLRTQQELTIQRRQRISQSAHPNQHNPDQSAAPSPSPAGKLLNSVCTYQFKRLPLLGSFINGLFLAALLMSAAIEGIQTCFHSSHSSGSSEKTILDRNELIKPLLTVGFALVGLIMQHCSLKAHEMRELELCSDSVLNVGPPGAESAGLMVKELSVNQLPDVGDDLGGEKEVRSKRKKYDLKLACGRRQASIEPIASTVDQTQISLRSLKVAVNQAESLPQDEYNQMQTISKDLEAADMVAKTRMSSRLSASERASDKLWFLVRYLSSPLALLVYALIHYFINDELITEVSDAFLAVFVVGLLFTASYPPMKKAGKILLQSAPDGVDLGNLERQLKSMSPLVLDVTDLKVWTITPKSNRVATCCLVLDKSQVHSESQVSILVHEARFKFLDQNIKCTTIEPTFKDLNKTTGDVE